MGKECENMGMERGEGERELNLELSIGYGKTENCKGEIRKLFDDNNVSQNSRSNFSCENDVCESVDLQRRREILALRRQEARRKREEKIKKSRGQNGLFAEDKLFLEAQKLQARAEERESRERDCVSEEKVRKKDKNSSDEVGGELSLSLFTDNKQQTERGECLYPKVQQHQHVAHRNGFQYSCGVLPSWAYSSADCDSEHSNGVYDRGNGNTTSNRSLEQCSSAVSDYQSMSQKGSSSDTGSHSPRRLHPSMSKTLESNGSWWSQAETDQVVGAAKLRTPSGISNSFDQTNSTSSKDNHNNAAAAAASMPKMPCVSATGNGPNGRTITGFLYKYTKAEVSIMCVCHGSSFSPAGFVEHAGGIDISHPLKHITLVNT
ncbi:hypothetical protein ACS0TY_015281 [Phlomoides rotata]